MIGRIKGILLEKKLPQLLIDVAGLGYEVEVSLNSFCHLPSVGANVTLYAHLVVREDCQTLYGFVTLEERSLFRSLIKVTGIGPKSALTILSSINPEEFIYAITSDDIVNLSRLPGVGKKTAQRLIIEMRDKLIDWELEIETKIKNSTTNKRVDDKTGNVLSTTKDAVSALISLGYKAQEAQRAILKHRGLDLSSEELIRMALKELAG